MGREETRIQVLMALTEPRSGVVPLRGQNTTTSLFGHTARTCGRKNNKNKNIQSIFLSTVIQFDNFKCGNITWTTWQKSGKLGLLVDTYLQK